MSDANQKWCPCGGVILADTEDWKTPLCHDCWVPLTRLDIPELIRRADALAEFYADGFAIMDHIDGTYEIKSKWYEKAREFLRWRNESSPNDK